MCAIVGITRKVTTVIFWLSRCKATSQKLADKTSTKETLPDVQNWLCGLFFVVVNKCK